MSFSTIVSHLSQEQKIVALAKKRAGLSDVILQWQPEDLLESLCVGVDIPFVKLTPEAIDFRAYTRFKKLCIEHKFIPLFTHDIVMVVACTEPWSDIFLRAARKALQMEVHPVGVTEKDFDQVLANLDSMPDPEGEPPPPPVNLEIARPMIGWDLSEFLGRDYIPLARQIITEAYRLKASDIHLDPKENRLMIRFRINGDLEPMPPMEKILRDGTVDAMKMLAQIAVEDVKDMRSGRIARIDVGNNKRIDLRVESQSTEFGDAIVARLLDPESISRYLGTLPFIGKDLQMVKAYSNKENGMILMTGPTGSGKTTTLYRMITNQDIYGRSVRTIEDPIEYSIDGLTQLAAPKKIQADGQLVPDFARVLRSHLRADPEVILVGEIRDADTAGTAVQAALTGHLIYSTLHTNDAPGVIQRLMDLGVSPKSIGLTVRLVVAQRLVGKLCPKCRIPEPPNDQIKRHFEHYKMPIPDVVFRKCGCSACGHFGNVGRMPLFEFLPITEDVKRCISPTAGEEKLRAALLAVGYRTLAQNGLGLVASGEAKYEDVETFEDPLVFEQ